MDDFEIELKNDFLAEAKDLLFQGESWLIGLGPDPSYSVLVDAILRFVHNLSYSLHA